MTLQRVLEQPVFRRRDLIAAGMSDRTVSRRIAEGTFVPVGPGLLCHRGTQDLHQTLDLAAHLSCGDPLTGPSSARIFPPGPVTEMVAGNIPWLLTRRRGKPPAVRLAHPAPEVVWRRGVLVASPRQSALDCLRVLPLGQARDLAYRCVQRGLLTAERITAEADLLRHHRGAPQLRHLGGLVSSNAHAESERLFHRRLRRAGLREWQANLWLTTPIGRVCIDIAFGRQLLAIEFDSPLTHASPDRFRQDRRKRNALMRLGWRVLNYTWSSITDAWPETLAEIRFFLRVGR